MTKLKKWEKHEILDLYKRNRAHARCKLVQKLTAKSNELTLDLDVWIANLYDELNEVKTQKIKILKDNNLAVFEKPRYGCMSEKLHPSLVEFDNETDRTIQDIIYDRFDASVVQDEPDDDDDVHSGT